MINENNKVYQLRKEKKLSAETLGDMIGVSQQTISRIESQEHVITTTDVAMKLAEYFGVTLEALLGKTELRSNSFYADLDPREVAEAMSIDNRRVWLETGVRLAGDDYMKKVIKRKRPEQEKK